MQPACEDAAVFRIIGRDRAQVGRITKGRGLGSGDLADLLPAA
ncbi:MAG: hypothetical protein WGN25_11400 [Candidatus Electrothrix sp. GW3-4]